MKLLPEKINTIIDVYLLYTKTRWRRTAHEGQNETGFI